MQTRKHLKHLSKVSMQDMQACKARKHTKHGKHAKRTSKQAHLTREQVNKLARKHASTQTLEHAKYAIWQTPM